MPRFSGFLNIETLEAELAQSYRQSLQEKVLHLDLRYLEWISPLSLSVIYSWAWEIISAHGSVTLIPPQLDSFAASFFNSAEVLARFKSRHLSVDTASRGGKTFLKRKITAFEVFDNRSSFETYIGNLNDEPQRSLLLHSDDPPELVSSGHFHRIVLQELIDNTFAHTDGNNSHYVAFEADPAQSGTRKAHSIISPMSGQGYIEVCVADSSKRNLVDTLKRFLPPNYQPLGAMDLHKNHKKLDPIELCILYAFEYGSTSRLEERVRKIAEWLAQPAESASGIATGLYNVLSLAKFYGGQIIVRTAGRLGTLDFTDYGYGFPRIAFWNSLRGARLARLKGTIILIRVPVRRAGTEKYVMPKPRQQAETSRGKQTAIRVISPRTNASSPSNLTEILLDLEQRATEALRFGISTPNIVAVVLDGLALPSKAFGAFLELLARIPRYRSALVVIVDDPQYILAAAEQWERIRDSASGPDEFLRQPAFLLTVDHTTAASIYGSHEHAEATILTDNRAVLPFGESLPLEELIDPIRTQRLGEALAQPPVCHESGLYLIESAYYTERFYEVHGLLVNELTRQTLVLWLRSEFAKVNPDVVIYDATFLEPVLKDALRPLNNSDREIQLLLGRACRKTLLRQ